MVLLASALVACGSESEEFDDEGRFDDEPTRTDDVVSKKPGKPKGGDAPAPGAPEDSTPDAEEPGNTVATNTCETARDLGAIIGDAEGSTVTAQGSCSEWVRIRATEQRTGPLAAAMMVTATLVSPPGTNFDLRVLVNPEMDSVECSTESGRSDLPAGRSDIAKVQWGEGYLINGSDDSRPVSIEVRAKSPADCGKGSWTLLIAGNE